MQNAKNATTLPWRMSHLESAISKLKNYKSKDPDGYANEIFKSEVAGTDLKESLLILCTRLKVEDKIPGFINTANITTVPKKGSRLSVVIEE